MADSTDLESLYNNARSALRAKDYDRASNFLRQILLIDENYKDASRLLAQTVKLRRRHWYSHPLLLGGLGLAFLTSLGVWLVPRLSSLATRLVPTPAATLTVNVTDSPTAIPTFTPSPAPTSLPLSWKRVNTGQIFPRDTITAIVVNPEDPDVIYVGMENAGIYKSIDAGNSWQPVEMGLNNASITSLAINPNVPGILFAGALSGNVYKTTDGGAVWRARDIGIGDAGFGYHPRNLVIISPQSPEILYDVRGGGSVFQSTDDGSSWRPFDNFCQASVNSLIVSPINSDVLYAAIESSDQCNVGIYKSLDGGKSWEMVFQFPEALINLGRLRQNGDNFSISQDGQVVLYNNEDNSYISYEGGIAWKDLDRLNCSLSSENGSLVMCLNQEAGMSKSLDAGTSFRWLMIYQSAWGADAFITFKPGSPETIFIGGKGFYQSTDGGSSWTNTSNGLGGTPLELMIQPNNPANLYGGIRSSENQAATVIHDLYSSGDDGKNWSLTTLPRNAYGLAIDADGNTVYRLNRNESVIGLTDLLRSMDNGRSWVSHTIPYSKRILNVISNPFIPGNLYVIAENEDETRLDFLYSSQDGGTTWKKVETPLGLIFNSLAFASRDEIYLLENSTPRFFLSNGETNVRMCEIPDISSSAFAIDPINSLHLYLGTKGDGVYTSRDACIIWSQINIGLGSLFVNTIAINPNNPDTIYAGTDGGAYVSFDDGETWSQINDGLLGATVVYSIVVDNDSNVYASTPYGIFTLESK